jgi:predicted SnoaL-like aldol condensation-catalyzing enzyme
MGYDLEQGKRLIEGIFDVIYGKGDNFDTIDDLVAEDYIQHNPMAGQGPAGLKAFLKTIVPRPPGFGRERILDVAYVCEGNLIVRRETSTIGLLIDIFRIEDGKLKEHWDAFRPIDESGQRLPGF